MESSDYFGFPCVISRDSPMLAGYITRKDILFALREGERGRRCSARVVLETVSVTGRVLVLLVPLAVSIFPPPLPHRPDREEQ